MFAYIYTRFGTFFLWDKQISISKIYKNAKKTINRINLILILNYYYKKSLYWQNTKIYKRYNSR